MSTNRTEKDTTFDQAVDLCAIVVLLAICGVVLLPAFGTGLSIGLTLWGALIGIGVVVLTSGRTRRVPFVVGCLFGAFLVASGPSVSYSALFGVLPSPASLTALLKGLIHGWRDATTTAPPLGISNGFGVIPYVGGFLAATISIVVARRTRMSLAPLIPVTLLLVANILLSTKVPQALLIQGGLFGVVALGWGAHREARKHRMGDGGFYLPRVAWGAAMLVVVMLVGLVGGPKLFSVDTSDRYVIRDHVEPPLDPRDYPSPLNGFRNYVSDRFKDTAFFEVKGLPDRARIRLATMDTYDGVVWAVGGPTAPASGFFDRVGTSILPTPVGTPHLIDFEVLNYRDVWVPTVGSTRSNRFTGERSDKLNGSFRFNQSTGDGATLIELTQGDTFEVDVRTVTDRRKGAVDKRAASEIMAALPPLPDLSDELRERASTLITGAVTDYQKAESLEKYFKEGYYSDGGPGAEPHMQSAPGHSLYRLEKFLDPTRSKPVGNAEQYAAAMALMARVSGLPARVVMGFDVPKEDRSNNTVVRGTHVHAWVEIAFDQVGWVAFDPTPDRDQVPEPQKRTNPQTIKLVVPPEPVHKYVKPPDLDFSQVHDSSKKDPIPEKPSGMKIPAWLVTTGKFVGIPVLMLLLAIGAIAGAKMLRRRRRRSAGDPTARIVGAWRDSLSTLIDLGVEPAPGATRHEMAQAVPEGLWQGATPFASAVDQSIFGPDPATDAMARELWERADTERHSMMASLQPFRRLKVLLSLRSLARSPGKGSATHMQI